MERSTLRTSTPSGDDEHGRGEVQDAGDAGGDHPVGDVLGGGGRGGDHADGDAVLARRSARGRRTARTSTPATTSPCRCRVGVEQGDDAEAAAAEAGVVGERVAEVADADDDDRPVLGHADLAGDLVAQVVHVVPDAAGAVAAEVGEVLAELGAVDAGGGGELLAGAGGGAGLGEGGQRPQVDGQPGHGRLGNLPGAVVGRPCAHSCRLSSRRTRRSSPEVGQARPERRRSL